MQLPFSKGFGERTDGRTEGHLLKGDRPIQRGRRQQRRSGIKWNFMTRIKGTKDGTHTTATMRLPQYDLCNFTRRVERLEAHKSHETYYPYSSETNVTQSTTHADRQWLCPPSARPSPLLYSSSFLPLSSSPLCDRETICVIIHRAPDDLQPLRQIQVIIP